MGECLWWKASREESYLSFWLDLSKCRLPWWMRRNRAEGAEEEIVDDGIVTGGGQSESSFPSRGTCGRSCGT